MLLAFLQVNFPTSDISFGSIKQIANVSNFISVERAWSTVCMDSGIECLIVMKFIGLSLSSVKNLTT